MTADLRALDCLGPNECRDVRDALRGMRDLWRTPGPSAPFFFLGAASYIDGRGREGLTYQQRVAGLRPIMLDRLGWLYERIAAALAVELGAATAYPDALGLPGFHIYEHCPELAAFVPSVHVDLQYRYHDWTRFGSPNLEIPLSFTLAIAVPSAGAALNLWPLTLEQCTGLSRDEVSERLRAAAPARHTYRPGAMVVHSGLQFHQIAPLGHTQPDDERITLQGHAVACDGTWYLYW